MIIDRAGRGAEGPGRREEEQERDEEGEQGAEGIVIDL
jgi:hypothetical protein